MAFVDLEFLRGVPNSFHLVAKANAPAEALSNNYAGRLYGPSILMVTRKPTGQTDWKLLGNGLVAARFPLPPLGTKSGGVFLRSQGPSHDRAYWLATSGELYAGSPGEKGSSRFLGSVKIDSTKPIGLLAINKPTYVLLRVLRASSALIPTQISDMDEVLLERHDSYALRLAASGAAGIWGLGSGKISCAGFFLSKLA